MKLQRFGNHKRELQTIHEVNLQKHLLRLSAVAEAHRVKSLRDRTRTKSLVVKPSRMAERSKKQVLNYLIKTSPKNKDLKNGAHQGNRPLYNHLKTRVCKERKSRREHLFRAGAGRVNRKKPQNQNKWTPFSFVRCN